MKGRLRALIGWLCQDGLIRHDAPYAYQQDHLSNFPLMEQLSVIMMAKLDTKVH